MDKLLYNLLFADAHMLCCSHHLSYKKDKVFGSDYFVAKSFN